MPLDAQGRLSAEAEFDRVDVRLVATWDSTSENDYVCAMPGTQPALQPNCDGMNERYKRQKLCNGPNCYNQEHTRAGTRRDLPT